MKVLEKSVSSVKFATRIGKVTGKYTGVLLPKSLAGNFPKGQEVVVCITKR